MKNLKKRIIGWIAFNLCRPILKEVAAKAARRATEPMRHPDWRN